MTTRSTSLAVLNLAAVVERCDEQILPAVYFFLGRSLNASLPELGILTLCRAISQALASPLSGILSDRYDRTLIVAAGCTLWGVMTSAIGLSTSLRQAMVACAFNGLGLALVIPTLQSLIADSTEMNVRGKAFGVMGFISSFGGMGGALFATNIGGRRPFGVEGWRWAFHVVAAVSLGTAWLVRRYAVDPGFDGKQEEKKARAAAMVASSKNLSLNGSGSGGDEGVSLKTVVHSIRTVLRIPSFQVIVLQGIVGSIPWQALVMLTLWLQLLGFSNFQASMLSAIFTLGNAFGGLLGGALGDAAARHSPMHGRITIAQISVFAGCPFSFLLFKGLLLPSQHHQAADADVSTAITLLYAVVFLAMGLCVSWCYCNNSAIFAELVPEHLRTHIFAFDRSFEGAIGACGAPLVGIAAERLFGFQPSMNAAASSPTEKAVAAHALSNALLLCLVVPWTACLLSYSMLHFTFPKDKLRALKLAGQGVPSSSMMMRRVDSKSELEQGSKGTRWQ